MRRRRFSVTDFTIFALAAIGVLSMLVNNPAAYLIPLVVLGGVFLLYKYPPNTLGSLWKRSNVQPGRKKKKTPSFRVIRGSKGVSDNDHPRYH